APALRNMHEELLVNWIKSGRSFFNSHEFTIFIQLLVTTSLTITMVISYLGSTSSDSSGTLLLLYWMLLLPLLGTQLAEYAQQYPSQHNRLLRLLEPLGTADEKQLWYDDINRPAFISKPFMAENEAKVGIAINFNQVNLDISGKRLLHQINITLTAGTHVAIVGKSGAGKSSLVGLLLGWYRPASGSLWVDGELLHGEYLQTLRREMVWVDPEIKIWNKSLNDNINYGNDTTDSNSIDTNIWQQAELLAVLDALEPEQKLGENGGLLSGGEAQRVRLGRAMNRSGVRLVILDEPFRGLTGEQRRSLLKKARRFWQQATLIFISHDVADTQEFDRVLVMDGGYLVENAAPISLAAQESSYYAALLKAEREARNIIWNSANWRKLRLDNGRIEEE
ncbi:MAG: ATP-binding cassette domain-containing protein, partial [Mariprofundales bacterium]